MRHLSSPNAFVLVLLAAAWFFMPDKFDRFKKEIEETMLEEEPMTEKQDVVAGKPEASQAELADEETPAPETIPNAQPAGKRYYVVAGCFKDIRNARNYVQHLQGKGYDASIFGMRQGLHAVSFNSHPTRQAAVEELNRIRQNYDPKAWVLYY